MRSVLMPRTIFPDAETLPNSAKMTAYREQTFGDWWPHKHPSIKEVSVTLDLSLTSACQCGVCFYTVSGSRGRYHMSTMPIRSGRVGGNR